MSKHKTNLLKLLWGLCTCALLASGQPRFGVNVAWLPITEAEKAMKESVVEKDAGVEALFWRAHVRDEYVGSGDHQRVLYHYIRLKVFNEKGKDAATTISIPYGNDVSVSDIAGRTVQADGTIVELKGDDIQTKDVVKVGRIRHKAKAFAMPAVAPGAIVEYRWKEIHFNTSIFYLRAEYQREFPIQKVTYFLQPLSREVTAYQMAVRHFGCQPSKLKLENDGYNSMSVENIPAFREEPMMPGEPNVRQWSLIFYSDDDGSNPQKYWDNEGKDIYRHLKLSVKVSNEMKAVANEAVSGAQSDEEKAVALIRYIRKNLRNFFSSSVTEAERAKILKQMPKTRRRTSEEVFKSGIGFPNELNILFAGLASVVGMEARAAHVSDRNGLAFHPNLANSYFLPNIDMAVNTGGKWQVYDVSARLMSPSMLHWTEEGATALISDSKKPEFVMTPLSDPDKSTIQRIGRFELKEDGSLEGSAGLALTGHKAYNERVGYDGSTPEKQQEDLKEEIKAMFPDAEVTDIVIENVEDPEQPLRIRYKVRIPGYAQRTGKRLLFNPLYFQKGVAPLFAATERKYPVDLKYAWMEADSITFTWPEGFALETPENPGGMNFGEPGMYDLQMAVRGRELAVTRKLVFGNKGLIMFPKESYAALKGAFDEIHRRDGATLIVKEAGSGAATK